jgi:hypothetical protein
MSGEQSKRLDALLESVTNSVSKMEVHVSPVPSMTCIVGSRLIWGTGPFFYFLAAQMIL